MITRTSRRQFLGATVALAASAPLLSALAQETAGTTEKAPYHGKMSKALITKTPDDAFCERLTKAGFDGMEVGQWEASVDEARKARQLAEKHGLRIHSVMRGWANFNQADKFDGDIKSVETALRAAAAYGASTVLLVPCRVGGGGLKMPEAWDFSIDFNPKTLKVKSVATGDNADYADYIAAQNLATEQSIKAIEALIPTAAKEGVIIAIENVWNNLWCTPEFFAAFVNYFDNPWVRTYFDLGNHTKYARCENWLKALGSSIVKLHIKDFAVTEPKGNNGGGPGNWAGVGEGTIDWKNVRKTLDEIRYNGWITVEPAGGKLTDEQHAEFLDKFIGRT